ncbi:MAG: cyclic nucleotide-binding domain-containing protein [Chloroflexi bacterium]|nr:MAG: cyclic nucleotide-binding domain-containing protein [Chloroflexota bacterium]TMD68712.1 MAG: cyclic nucleotide-binding domain-containing protein [Chloroflexota bacterium]
MAVKTDPTESLRRVPLFAGLDKKELEVLGKLIKEQPYRAGTTIVKSGAGGHGLYIIKEGRVSVVRDGQSIASLGPGQFFGEISVLDGGPRTADVRADTDTVCLTMISWEVKPILMDNASISYKMLLEMVKRLRTQSPHEQD